ncbi:hypothetical protein CROQUDRAFT_668074 [Cronartium quercuum f. sp. fusiforme G11]|uniref:Uncharacterized protein n=1 Tax=Cronartium quercuum f. sp. fusiforme G11 TaxID=708437 RepID=A0A9P6NSL7_9BASI|nr:hypothetical protein CROQUDRAFT_668074 [Cronartium quercuum f. sp. fusiforme G11]
MELASFSSLLLFSFLSWFINSSVQSGDPNGNRRMKKRCTYVDDGLIAKDCGKAPTTAEFEAFMKKQAADVEVLSMTKPCGFTFCSKMKMKRDLDFVYRSKSQPDLVARGTLPVVKRDLKATSVSHRSQSLVKRNLNGPPRPRPANRRQLLAASLREGSRQRDLKNQESLLERRADELHTRQASTSTFLADNTPVTGLPDGNLKPYRSLAISPPENRELESNFVERQTSRSDQGLGDLEERDLIENLVQEAVLEKKMHESELERREMETRSLELGNSKEVVVELLRRGVEVSEKELIARHLPVIMSGDGKLHLFGTRSVVRPPPEDSSEHLKRELAQAEVHAEIEG